MKKLLNALIAQMKNVDAKDMDLNAPQMRRFLAGLKKAIAKDPTLAKYLMP